MLERFGRPGAWVTRSHLTAVIWVGGIASVALMAYDALRYLRVSSLSPWRGNAGLPDTDLLIAAGAVVLIAAAIAGTYLIAGKRPRAAIAISLAALVAVRLALAIETDARLFSDYLAYRGIATGMLAGYGFWTSLPPGYPLLEAIGIAIGGPSLIVGEIVNVLFELVAGVCVVLIVRRMAGVRAAAVAGMALALTPSQILTTVVLGTEVAYGASLALIVLAAQRSISGRAAPMIVCGMLLGLSQYIRPTSQLFAPAVLVALLLAVPRPTALLRPAAAMCLAFLVIVAPVAAWNFSENGRLSLSPSLFDKWTLYVGLNYTSRGQYRLSDRLAVSKVAGVPFPIVGDGLPGAAFRPDFVRQSRAFNDAAGALVPERLAANRTRILSIQPAKFRAMWERADYSVELIFGPDAPQPSPSVAAVAALVAQVAWVALLAGALIGLVALRRERPFEITIVVLVVLTAVAVHAVSEVQSRYHEYYVPLLYILVGGAVRSLDRARAVRAARAAPDPSAAAA